MAGYVVTGGDLTVAKVLFTPDSKYMFICSHSLIKLHLVSSGAIVRILRGHDDAVTALALDPGVPSHLYSASLDGTVRYWDYETALLLETVNVGNPVVTLVVHPLTHSLYVTTNVISKKNKERSALFTITNNSSTESAGFSHSSFDVTTLMPVELVQSLLVTQSGSYIILVFRASVLLFHVESGKKKAVKHPRKISSVAVDPRSQSLAIGDEGGQITIHENSLSEEGEKPLPPRTLTQWHRSTVGGLIFDSTGTHLISAGTEATLVWWELSSGRKEFLPRLGADPVLGLSNSLRFDLLALSCADNAIRLVNPRTKTPLTIVRGLALSERSATLVPWPRDPHTLSLVGVPGCLQLYNTLHDASRNITIADRVRPSAQMTPSAAHKARPRIKAISYSADGRWLATTTRQTRGSDLTATTTISFLRWNDADNIYVKHTSAERAHKGEVTGLVLHPTLPLALSTGSDGFFRIWGLQDASRDAQQPEKWVVLSAGSYRGGAAAASTCAWSDDGSLFAVSYAHVVTLWQTPAVTPASLSSSTVPVLATTLADLPPSEHISGLRFSKHRLIAWGKRQISTWDLVHSALSWSLRSPKPIWSVTVSNLTHRLLIHVHEGKRDSEKGDGEVKKDGDDVKHSLLVLEPTSPTPVSVLRLPGKIKGVTWLRSLPKADDAASDDIAVLDFENVLHRYSTNSSALEQAVKDINSTELVTDERALEELIEGMGDLAMLATPPTDLAPPVETVPTLASNGSSAVLRGAIEAVFAGPPHVLPNPTLLVGHFLNRLLEHTSLPAEPDLMEIEASAAVVSPEEENPGVKDVAFADSASTSSSASFTTQALSSHADTLLSSITRQQESKFDYSALSVQLSGLTIGNGEEASAPLSTPTAPPKKRKRSTSDARSSINGAENVAASASITEKEVPLRTPEPNAKQRKVATSAEKSRINRKSPKSSRKRTADERDD